MKQPSFSDSFQVLLLQLADQGRSQTLLGGDDQRARSACLPFLVGKVFPDTYLEFPLTGDPFLDVTLLLGEMEPGTRIDSDAACNTEAMLDWYAQARNEHPEISFGFELDTSKPELPSAGVHFQPRSHTELVVPFLEAAGEPERAERYLDLAARMPSGWPLSFFGMFRGRPNFPLRVCGYLDGAEQAACASDPAHLANVFDIIGFQAYDDAMLSQVSSIMAAAPGHIDFQFDVYPDGRLSDVFAIDVQFGLTQPAATCESFERGPVRPLMTALEDLGAADERWHLAIRSAFARAIPIEREDGTLGLFGFTLLPQWMKTRWTAGVLQPAKMYCLGNAKALSR